MRRFCSVGLVAIGASIIQPVEAGAATPLDFLFGGPQLASRPAYRLRRRPAPPPAEAVPLPVPRPHFPGDPAPTPDASASARTPNASPAMPKSGSAAPAAAPFVTQPAPATDTTRAPERPEREPTTTPPPSTAAPAASVEPAPKPQEPAAVVPLPPSKPAELQTPPREPPSKTEAPGGAASVPTAPTGPSGPALPPTPPTKPAELAAPPAPGKPATPAVAPSGATTAFTPRAPEDDPQCPTRLIAQKVGIEPTTIGPQPDARCTVVEAVHLDDVTLPDGAKVSFPEHPTIACVTADSFSSYVRDMLSPLAKGTFGAPVVAVWTGPGLECRSRDSVFGAKLSAHGQGLAIDIAKLKLADGRIIEVGTPKTDAETAFETAARAGACGYFHTVLGPGSDAYHRTHWHFDLEVRGTHGDSKYCK